MSYHIIDYQKFIEENLDYIEYLHKEIKHWNSIKQKRALEAKWTESLQEIVDNIKILIKKNMDECQYYLKRIEEIKNGHDISSIQFITKNREDVIGEGR